MTQGRTRAGAIRMFEDLVATMADEKGFEVEVRPGRNGVFAIEVSDEETVAKLAFHRQREKLQSSAAGVAKRLV